ncbi:hypothetical protein Pth03_33090 [Planotetraspora thailandica]|uniref:Uncharacterized protein n=1 Tax=Planotetraspora thailandica TaxID=487172 RepID=A0A8J3XWG3_9ACTN|nr:hypothetical protein Pth03_33090 [Planotetraspora thailandica]
MAPSEGTWAEIGGPPRRGRRGGRSRHIGRNRPGERIFYTEHDLRLRQQDHTSRPDRPLDDQVQDNRVAALLEREGTPGPQGKDRRDTQNGCPGPGG